MENEVEPLKEDDNGIMAPDLGKALELLTHYPNLRRSGRGTKEPDRYGNQEYGMVKASSSVYRTIPGRITNLKTDRTIGKWRQAIDGEIRRIIQKEV